MSPIAHNDDDSEEDDEDEQVEEDEEDDDDEEDEDEDDEDYVGAATSTSVRNPARKKPTEKKQGNLIELTPLDEEDYKKYAPRDAQGNAVNFSYMRTQFTSRPSQKKHKK